VTGCVFDVVLVAPVAPDTVVAVLDALELVAVVPLVLAGLDDVTVVAAMQPVTASMPATLDAPTIRRARCAGCGRRRRAGAGCCGILRLLFEAVRSHRRERACEGAPDLLGDTADSSRLLPSSSGDDRWQ
jgi:hypothetical protein